MTRACGSEALDGDVLAIGALDADLGARPHVRRHLDPELGFWRDADLREHPGLALRSHGEVAQGACHEDELAALPTLRQLDLELAGRHRMRYSPSVATRRIGVLRIHGALASKLLHEGAVVQQTLRQRAVQSHLFLVVRLLGRDDGGDAALMRAAVDILHELPWHIPCATAEQHRTMR
eukprot:CAMPEP_0170448382 /NCGR_PEP_ID=MMETSP0117_2-20130122/50678_1 /TAXON_ID=400756 /ORGANISM="Durinskia baltica, Strain CSIRO CS-38" /LENGTH=177 /DNA_ID=CAMNT_0010709547 /DNA_START=30 /DNA_END=564 /DNA_ORIENTATION=+